VTRYEPKLEKVMRVLTVTSTIENGFVHLPDKAEGLGEYLHELTCFPKGKFDDQCDSTSQALDWIKTGHSCDGFLKWLELEAAKAKSGSFADGSGDACPACHSRSISTGGPQKRCTECGKQWGRDNRSFSLPTRADVLSGRCKRSRDTLGPPSFCLDDTEVYAAGKLFDFMKAF
jgi:hypothetical protein